MKLYQLEYFRQLARTQHYTQAARQLSVSQSTLSHAMASLEDELGCKLFRREGRNVALTDAGVGFAQRVEAALEQLDLGVAELQQSQGYIKGQVVVGAIATVRSFWLPAAMKAYREEWGDATSFVVRQGETATLNSRLTQGELDLALSGPVDIPGVACETLFYQELMVCVNRNHPLAAKSSVTYEDLAEYDLVSYRPGIACGNTLTAFLGRTQAPFEEWRLERTYEDEVILSALALQENRVALLMCTSNVIQDPNILLIPLAVPGSDAFYPVSLTYRTRAQRTPAAQTFLTFLQGFKGPAYTHPCDIRTHAHK